MHQKEQPEFSCSSEEQKVGLVLENRIITTTTDSVFLFKLLLLSFLDHHVVLGAAKGKRMLVFFDMIHIQVSFSCTT